MTVTDIASHRVSSWNRQTYQRLKLALSLGLRRQIFLVVCDDLSLRNRLAGKLHTELGTPSAKALRHSQGEPKLVSLNLNLSDPNPLGQIIQWLAKNRQSRSSTPIPGFQILGAELLTRQPPATQRLFLRRLQAIERNLLRLESTLLLWLPRPWFHTIQQSAPEFWQLHTGIFEFEGEPTPLPPVGSSRPETSRVLSTPEATEGSFKDDLQTLLAHELEETVEPPPLREIIWEKPYPQENWDHNLTPKETPTEKTGNTSNGHVIPYPFLDFLGTTNNPNLATPPLSPKEATNSTESALPPLLGNASKAPPLKLDPDLKLDDQSQELDTDPIDQFQIPTFNSDELIEELSDGSSTLQPSNLLDATQEEQLSESPAETYLKLGYYYRQIIEQGDASEENLLIATQAYELALQFLEDTSPQLSDVRNDLGNLYWMLSRCPESTDEHRFSYLEQSIQAYQLALTKLVAEEAPQTYSMIQNNLGAAYGDLARYKDSAENLEQSIRAYEEALRYRLADSEPMKYASTQNNLGTAYWHLAQYQSPVGNLQAAIAAYSEALSYYHPQSEPMNWAMIQNNLGTAYWNLAQYEQPETWLELAIVSYQEALKYRTAEVAPTACAATQNNLGTAYWHLADQFPNQPERRENNLQQCISAYEIALALVQQLAQNLPPISVNFDVLSTRNNLGLAHYQLAVESQFSLSQDSKFTHLDSALQQHIKACTSATAELDVDQTALSYIVRIIRTFYEEGGISGQNRALSQVPGQLLPEILPLL